MSLCNQYHIKCSIMELRKNIIDTCKSLPHINIRRKWNKLVEQSNTIYPKYHVCEDHGHIMLGNCCKYCGKTYHMIHGSKVVSIYK